MYRQLISLPNQLVNTFWHQRQLIRQVSTRNLRAEVKGSLIGLFWLLLNPLLMLGVYSFVFGGIFGARFDSSPNSGAQDYVLGLFLGLSIYQLLASVLMSTPGLIHQHPGYVKKIVFPLEVLPISNVCAAAVRFFASMALLIGAMFLLGCPLDIQSAYLPVCIAPVFLMAFGLSFALSGLGVFFRDLPQISSFLSIILLYSSGVFYAASTVEKEVPGIWSFLRWNPILHAIDLSRKTLLWSSPPDAMGLLYIWVSGVIIFILGFAIFKALRPTFADVV